MANTSPKWRYYLKLTLFVALLGIAVNLFGNLIWATAKENHPAFPTITKHLVAALLEPTTTKLIPAIAVTAYARLYRLDLAEYISAHTFRLAVFFGFIVGFSEFGLFLLKGSYISIFVPLSLLEVIRCRATPVLMHTITGTLIALPVFSLVTYQVDVPNQAESLSLSDDVPTLIYLLTDDFFRTLLVGTLLFLLAQLFHVWWNTGGNNVVSRLIGLAC